MIKTFTDFYRFERIAQKAKHRMDCTASTESYPEFENKRATKNCKGNNTRDEIKIGDLIIYWVASDSHIKAHRKRKADRSITIKSNNLSSVYNWKYIEDDYWVAYGDFKGTTDALLIIHRVKEIDATIQAGSIIDVFIARGKSNECHLFCSLYEEGAFDEELNILREQALNK